MSTSLSKAEKLNRIKRYYIQGKVIEIGDIKDATLLQKYFMDAIFLLETIDELKSERAYEEWVCDNCNMVHPWKNIISKSIGFHCPDCDRLVQQKGYYEARMERDKNTELRKRIEELESQLSCPEGSMECIACEGEGYVPIAKGLPDQKIEETKKAHYPDPYKPKITDHGDGFITYDAR